MLDLQETQETRETWETPEIAPIAETQETTDQLARKLMEAFGRFRQVHWRESPIPGLTSGEMMIMFSIMRACGTGGAGLKVSDLSNILHVSAPTVTQQVNSLVANGYVEKRADKDDRRVVRITLTARGTEIVHKAFGGFFSAFQGLVAYLGSEDSATLARLMSKLAAYFEELKQANAAIQE